MYMTGLHASLALVFIILFFPKNIAWTEKFSPLRKFEHDFQTVVDYGLFFFGITNAGVSFSAVSSLTFIILLSLILGKIIGISSMAELSAKIGFGLPEKIGHKELLLIGMIASIGLTVSLFIADSAYIGIDTQGAAKMGALMSIGAGFLAVLTSKFILKKPLKRRVNVFNKYKKTAK
jgi:NhaA family Na+:H+ antiporter